MRITKTYAILLLISLTLAVSIAAASSKISDDAYRLVRQLVSYKNREIDALHSLNQYMLDCQGVSDAQSAAKKCSDRISVMQTEDRDLQVKHDVLGQEIATHIRQHKDEEWLFMGLMLYDKEFSNLGH